MSDRFVTVSVILRKVTDMAVLVDDENTGEVWIPKSALSYESRVDAEALDEGDEFEMEVKEWLAKKNDLSWEG